MPLTPALLAAKAELGRALDRFNRARLLHSLFLLGESAWLRALDVWAAAQLAFHAVLVAERAHLSLA